MTGLYSQKSHPRKNIVKRAGLVWLGIKMFLFYVIIYCYFSRTWQVKIYKEFKLIKVLLIFLWTIINYQVITL
jgi:uncharacterized membrane protein